MIIVLIQICKLDKYNKKDRLPTRKQMNMQSLLMPATLKFQLYLEEVARLCINKLLKKQYIASIYTGKGSFKTGKLD